MKISDIFIFLFVARYGGGCLSGCVRGFFALLLLGIVLFPITYPISRSMEKKAAEKAEIAAEEARIRAGVIKSLDSDDPSAMSKALAILQANPNDNELIAAIGHAHFINRQDAERFASSLKYLQGVVEIKDTDRYNRIPLSRWDGRARYELAQLCAEKEEFDKALELLDGISDADSSGDDLTEDQASMIRFRASIHEAAGRYPAAVADYLKYFDYKMENDGLTPDDMKTFLRILELSIKSQSHTTPRKQRVNLDRFTATRRGKKKLPFILSLNDKALIEKSIEMVKSKPIKDGVGDSLEKQWKQMQAGH